MDELLPLLSRRSLVMAATGLVASWLTGCRDGQSTPAATPAATPATTPATTAGPTTSQSPIAEVPPPEGEGDWATTTASAAGLTEAGVAALVELVAASNSQSFVLLHDGRIVAEQYWRGADAATVRDVASVQKSIVSTLMGIARDRSVVSFDDTVTGYLGAGWSAAAQRDESRVTLRHLITMTSGLHPRTLEKASEPGAVWDYNTAAYQKLRRVLEEATGAGIDALTRQWLFDELGVSAAAGWAPRPGAVDAVGEPQWGLRLTARDMARIGLLAMRDGGWASGPLVPAGWFAEAWAPIAQKADYGYLWWLIGRGGLAAAGAPRDAVAALGAQDQKVYVLPSDGLVLARQGDAARGAVEAQGDFDRLLVGALHAAAG